MIYYLSGQRENVEERHISHYPDIDVRGEVSDNDHAMPLIESCDTTKCQLMLNNVMQPPVLIQ